MNSNPYEITLYCNDCEHMFDINLFDPNTKLEKTIRSRVGEIELYTEQDLRDNISEILFKDMSIKCPACAQTGSLEVRNENEKPMF